MTDDPSNYAEASDSAGQGYILVKQTDYDQTGDATRPLTYLQIGAYPSWGTASEQGDDLLDTIGIDTSTTLFFKDDYRYSNGQTATGSGSTLTTYERQDGNATDSETTPQALTSELMTRGGWRLHTDGNYVSTTRGDRVDVIFGNHHLAVLGRTGGSSTDAVWKPAYWESSGGHAVRDDVAQRGRLTSVEWNAARSGYTTYHNTLKGKHTERFQGPLESVYECDTWTDTVGGEPVVVTVSITEMEIAGATIPVATPSTSANTIPATTSDPHEQSDAASNWVNPSTGAGTDWPRARSKPDVTEDFAAGSFEEKTTVTTALGTTGVSEPDAGSISIARSISSSYSKTVGSLFTPSANVKDAIYADSGATVTEALGFRAELVGETGDDSQIKDFTRWRLCVGDYEASIFSERSDCFEGRDGMFNYETQAIAMDACAQVGVRMWCVDFSSVKHPTFTKGSFYTKEGWGKKDVVGNIIGTVTGFGSSEMDTRILVNTFQVFAGARASVVVSPLASRVRADYLETYPIGTRTEIGLFKAIGALVKSGLRAVRNDTTAIDLSMSPFDVST